MGFETKILTAIGEVAPHKASFSCGTLSLVDVSRAELEAITEAIRDVVPFTPFMLRHVGDEYLVDFDPQGG